MTRRIDMTGKTYGKLLVVVEQGRYLNCKCECGQFKTILRGNVLAGYTQSCGCWRNARILETCGTHKKSYTELYKRYKIIKRRCYNPNHEAYPWYGGKGIKLCERWLDFENFYADNADAFRPELSIDRIDPDKDYSPENCRWIPHNENCSRSKRRDS